MTYDDVISRLVPGLEYHQNRYARALDATLSVGCRWLDLGAGTRLHGGWRGSTQQDLAARARTVVGCDMVGQHLRQNPYLSGRVIGDGMTLPFRSGAFDLVTANMVLEHLEHPRRVFAEVSRVMAAGGRFVFVTPNRHHPVVWLLSTFVGRQVRRRIAEALEGRPEEHVFVTHYRANTERDVRHFAQQAGLDVQTLEVFPSYPMVRHPLVAVAAEAMFVRLTRTGMFRRMGSNLLGVLGKPVPDGG